MNLEKQALIYFKESDYSRAIKLYENAINLNPETITNYWYLGLAYLLQGDEETGEGIWMSVFLQSDDLENNTQELTQILREEGDNQFQKNNWDLARKIYEQIEKITPENVPLYQNLAYVYQKLNNYQQSEIIFNKIIATQPNDFKLYIDFANLLLIQYRREEAINILKLGIKNLPNQPNLYFNLMRVLKTFGNAKEAIKIAEEGLKLCPNDLFFKLENARILPILYNTEEEINYYRQRFTNLLTEIVNNHYLNSEEEQKTAIQAIALDTNFYLQYQGKNDKNLQQLYGNFIHKVMTKSDLFKSLKVNKINKNPRKKIGIVSSHFRDHNGANWALGWVKYLNKQEFIVNCYYLENIRDQLTLEFEKYSDNFYQFNYDLQAICHQIIEDKIDILIYTDIGMKPNTTLMAALRLAPHQCVTLGHPITSGLPTIDYYISRTLMESDNAQEHYTEKLILLPNIGICIPKPNLPSKIKLRSEFNLTNDSIIYLCCQSLFKYLPQFDYIYPVIAQQVNKAKFVFIEFPASNFVNQQFKTRLANIFAKYNLNYENYCVILPRLNEENFNQLALISDTFLDTLVWSADNTTRLAIACNLPIVTYPGEFMRSRHSYGHLKMIEVEDTIAYSEEEYINIAVKLGNNLPWRENIRKKIQANQHKLFNDLECIKGLENFCRSL